MDFIEMSSRIVLAALLGGAVGIEREIHGSDAGFRTHILVCLGSSLFMMISFLMSQEYGSMGTVDPSRIAAGVVTGIGFLGAGAVMRSGTSIQGLTTAASIWAVSAIGLAIGAGLFTAGTLTSGVVLVVLYSSRFKRKLDKVKKHR